MNKCKIIATIIVAAVLLSLVGCQKKAEITSYDFYRESYRAQYFFENNPEYLEHETILSEATEVARNKEESIEERLKAIDLLCEAEYLKANEQEEQLRDNFLYPASGPIAAEVFAEIETKDSEDFWQALDDSFSTKELMYAAAPYFSPDTVLKFYEDRDKVSDLIGMYLSNVIARSLQTNTANLYELAESMFENGYFDENSVSEVIDIFVSCKDTISIVDEALQYLSFFSTTVLPLLESNYPDDYHYWRTAKDKESSYYNPGLRITLSEEVIDLSHIQTAGTESPEAISSGKVIALIGNGSADEYPEVGTAPVLDGDFILNLPPERVPTTLAEVDYVVSITSMYEHVGEYQSSGKSVSEENPIYAIASYSHIAINDWHTGALLGYYGTVESDAPSVIFVVNNNAKGQEYAFAPYPKTKDIYQAVEAYISP